MPFLNHILFWRSKQPEDNGWRPVVGSGSKIYNAALPTWTNRLDVEALAVDAGPIILGIGALRYLSQLQDFGLTATANVFKNKPTIHAMHRCAAIITPVILTSQAMGIEYRYIIPRWASAREKRRDEDEVRQHVQIGMMIGLGSTLARSISRSGPRWSLMDVMLGGFIADVLLREYLRAHNL